MRNLALFAIMLLITCSGPVWAQAPNEVLIGPVNYQQNITGITVNVSSRAFLSVSTDNNGISLKVRVEADLFDLQNKIGSIVDTFSLPKNNCGSFSPKNPVVSLSKKEIDVSNGVLFRIGGTVVMWECVQNPVPNSKVEWVMKKIGPVKTKVPQVVTWPGDPIKTILATQPFEAALPFGISKRDDHTVGLDFSKPDIELQGQYAFITKGVLSIAGINLNDKAHDALQKAIDPQKLILTLPAEIAKYNPKIEDARLYGNAGHLTAEISMSAFVTGQNMTDLIGLLMGKQKG